MHHGASIEKFKSHLETLRYSGGTIKVYTRVVSIFLSFLNNKPVSTITETDIVRFQSEYIIARGCSNSYQNQVINGLKLFFTLVENRNIKAGNMRRPRREHRLPHILSKEEVKRILTATRNIKHRALLCVVYACGLRRGEVLGIRLTDIDSGRKILFIRQSKGKRDRVIPISPKVIELLREYYLRHRSKEYLFEGRTGGLYGVKSVE